MGPTLYPLGAWEFAEPAYIYFVDLERALDCSLQGIWWDVLWEYKMTGPSLRAIQFLCNHSETFAHISCTGQIMSLGWLEKASVFPEMEDGKEECLRFSV